MSLTPPIIVAEGSDVFYFVTVASAERGLEPVDVNASIYKAFDSAGQVLALSTVFDRDSGEERVALRVSEGARSGAEELRRLLEKMLIGTRQLDASEVDTLGLKELIQRLRKAVRPS